MYNTLHTCSLQAHTYTTHIQLCAEIAVAGCRYYLCDVKPEGVVSIIKVVTQMARVFPKHLAQLVQPVLPTVLKKFLEEDVSVCLIVFTAYNFMHANNYCMYICMAFVYAYMYI